jgi:hypothetical protein
MMKAVRWHYQGFVLTGYNNSPAVSSGIIANVLAKAVRYMVKETSGTNLPSSFS